MMIVVVVTGDDVIVIRVGSIVEVVSCHLLRHAQRVNERRKRRLAGVRRSGPVPLVLNRLLEASDNGQALIRQVL